MNHQSNEKIEDFSSKYGVAVIIGRFQVHELHIGHIKLINSVIERHKKVIIFLGVSPVIGTKRNPLDFDSRKRMLQQQYPNAVILSAPDRAEDKEWSEEIDRRIKEIYQTGKPLLYGSRDSFIPHYKGSFDTAELSTDTYYSGTEVRKEVSEEVRASSDFRAGKIYQAYNRYPISYATVDIAPINDNNQLLLGKKPHESKYRFVGGFVDPKDESYEIAAKRELHEEAGNNIEVDKMEYVCSMNMDDWRYRNEEDKIKTILFKTKFLWGRIQPSDDISELKWFELEDLKNEKFIDENIMDVHIPLMKKLIENLG